MERSQVKTNQAGEAAKSDCCGDVSSPILDKLQAVVLLAGSVRPTRLQESIGRSVLDLPLESELTILDQWQLLVEQFAAELGIEQIPVRVRIDQSTIYPKSQPVGQRAGVLVERDGVSYRGTGGVLHDISQEYEEDDYLLVASARQVMLQPLVEIVGSMMANGGDVCLVDHEDGTPSGLMLIRCGALSGVPPVGFLDMKEQVLPQISKTRKVSVVRRCRPTGLPVRRTGDYIRALRAYHLHKDDSHHSDDPMEEDWQAAFSVVEPGAVIASRAQLHDSVVLSGGRVEEDAVVVRSIVCPGMVVSAGQTAVDMVVESR